MVLLQECLHPCQCPRIFWTVERWLYDIQWLDHCLWEWWISPPGSCAVISMDLGQALKDKIWGALAIFQNRAGLSCLLLFSTCCGLETMVLGCWLGGASYSTIAVSTVASAVSVSVAVMNSTFSSSWSLGCCFNPNRKWIVLALCILLSVVSQELVNELPYDPTSIPQFRENELSTLWGKRLHFEVL